MARTSAGLTTPDRPEHAWLHESGRVRHESATDTEALEAFALCSRLEGIIPALEPSHALAYAGKILPDAARPHRRDEYVRPRRQRSGGRVAAP